MKFWRKKSTKWVSINDRLPRADRAYCVCKVMADGYILGVASYDGVRWIANDGQANIGWTHWVPILSPLPSYDPASGFEPKPLIYSAA